AISFETFHWRAEVAFDRSAHRVGASVEIGGKRRRLTQLAREKRRRDQRVVVKRRRAQVGLAGWKAVLELVAIGSDDPVRGHMAPAIFEAPRNERPELL